METIRILDYQPQFAEDFKRLNIAWISKYFVVEPHDLEQLDHPHEHILHDGGQILFALQGNTVVGTVALVKVDDTTMELAKMAVDENVRGLGIGKKLCLAAIEKARESGTKHLFLESNRKLAPALALYTTVGFQEVAMQDTPYSRADIRMAMDFE
ncbi:GNAT family N-acetyltransferase [Cytophagaceae bacterium YF14B1]|uniref:GNAT family N-acetyltransferase n=1 Tax=Xanthocytophaga flava TaxID=3048013 RepID=A0AAE3U9Q3_9BACT|nr:GNAT family N-acetyltransferase [Xanthocytophaga flavus]MDJ1484696.1 GNAT family N-acetyltransferase [Xanthocytophaga flavus]